MKNSNGPHSMIRGFYTACKIMLPGSLWKHTFRFRVEEFWHRKAEKPVLPMLYKAENRI